MSEYVKRDPFARTTLMRERETVDGPAAGCAWCGNVRWRKNRKGERTTKYLYRYHLSSDSGHVTYDGRMFCSTSCRNSYQG